MLILHHGKFYLSYGTKNHYNYKSIEEKKLLLKEISNQLNWNN